MQQNVTAEAPDPAAGELTALPKPCSCFQLGEEGEGEWKGKVRVQRVVG